MSERNKAAARATGMASQLDRAKDRPVMTQG
jgi:hypothetical protein